MTDIIMKKDWSSMIREFIYEKNIFIQHKFNTDNRQPIFSLTIPYFKSRFGFVPLNFMFWFQTFLLLTVQSMLNIFVAIIVYKFILVKRSDNSTNTKSSTSTSSYLIGYGIICPMLFFCPYFFMSVFPFENLALSLCLWGAFPNIYLLRTMEAIHGTIPPYGTENMTKFVQYFSATLLFQFDSKTKGLTPLSTPIMVEKIKEFMVVFFQTSVLYSILIPNGYKIAPERWPIESIWDFYYWGNLVNGFLMASLTSLVLEGGAGGLGLLQSIFSGIAMERFSDSPLSKSTSPSDFWGRRWDRPVATALKRGVFKPLLSLSSSSKQEQELETSQQIRQQQQQRKRLTRIEMNRHVAAAITFLVSGLIHEVVLYNMSLRPGIPNNPTKTPYQPMFGSHFFFFVVNGFILLMERVVQNYPVIVWMQSNLPRPIRTALVLLLVLPIANVFTDEYIKSSFYSDAAFAFPRIVYLGQQQ